MPLDFEFFKPDEANYYAVISIGSMVYSVSKSSFISESDASISDSAYEMTNGGLNRMYGSLLDDYLSNGVYVIRIYRKENASPSLQDELVASGRTGWSSATGSQCEPSNADDVSSIIAIQNLDSRGYSVRMTGSFLSNSNPEIGLAEIFASKNYNICRVSMSVYPVVSGVFYNVVSIRTNDSSKTVVQEISVSNNNGSFSFEFVPNSRCMTYLMNGNFIFALSSALNGTPRIAGNPENKSIPSVPGIPNISFERNAASTGISFRSV